MLSVERCREILGDKAASMTDAQIEEARDQLYALARIVIEMYTDQKTRRLIQAEREACTNTVEPPDKSSP